jgi:hypothetical protein
LASAHFAAFTRESHVLFVVVVRQNGRNFVVKLAPLQLLLLRHNCFYIFASFSPSLLIPQLALLAFASPTSARILSSFLLERSKFLKQDGEDLLHWSWLCRGSDHGDDRIEVS